MTVAEPDLDHVFLEPELLGLLGDLTDLLEGGLRALQENALQVAINSVLNTRSLPLSGLHEGLRFAYLLEILILLAPSTHFCSRACRLHLFFRLSCRASKWQMDVW